MSQDEPEPVEEAGKLSVWTVVRSTLAAAIGVQSRANKERDFGSGRVLPFVIAGVVFTALFVATLALVVSLVLRT